MRDIYIYIYIYIYISIDHYIIYIYIYIYKYLSLVNLFQQSLRYIYIYIYIYIYLIFFMPSVISIYLILFICLSSQPHPERVEADDRWRNIQTSRAAEPGARVDLRTILERDSYTARLAKVCQIR